MVDGEPIDQSYVLSPPTYPIDPTTGSEACGGQYFGPITVPDENVFVMGDNRTNSADSRAHSFDEYQGTITLDNVRGKVALVFYPFSRIGGVEDPDIQGYFCATTNQLGTVVCSLPHHCPSVCLSSWLSSVCRPALCHSLCVDGANLARL